MNPNSLTLTETALLFQLPYSRIVSTSTITFIKHADGIWWNYAHNVCTGLALQLGHRISAGSRAYLPNEEPPCYVKHRDGSWLNVIPPSEVFAQNNAAGQPVTGPSTPPLQVLPQTAYRRGAAPVDDSLVLSNVPMSAADRGHVPDATGNVFTGELAVQEKASIRFGLSTTTGRGEASPTRQTTHPGNAQLSYVESSGYRPRQHNLQRASVPIMRGQLAMAIAEEVRLVMDALEEINRPLTLTNGRRVEFEDLVLVDIRRVSRGSLQPTLAVRGA